MESGEQIIGLLKEHRDKESRAELLRIGIEKMEMQQGLCEDDYTGGVSAMVIDGLPRGNGCGNPTQQEALSHVFGYSASARDIAAARMELQKLYWDIETVQALLHPLSDTQRLVVEKHIMDGYSWNEMERVYDNFSRSTLRRAKKQALKKMSKNWTRNEQVLTYSSPKLM